MLALSPERAQLEAVDRHLAQCRSRIREQIRRIRACRNRGGDDRTSLELLSLLRESQTLVRWRRRQICHALVNKLPLQQDVGGPA